MVDDLLLIVTSEFRLYKLAFSIILISFSFSIVLLLAKYSLKTTEGLTEKDKALINENIQILNELILCYIFNKNTICEKEFSKFIDQNKILTKSTYENYKKLPKDIKKDILGCINKFSSLVDLYDPIELPNINLTNKELIELSHDFFKWLPTNNKKYEKLFFNFVNPNNHLLKFSKDDNSSVGSTFYLYYPFYKPFFSITRSGTIEDLTTLNHEFSHGIFMANDNNYSLNNNHYYLCELEGHFFEFLSIEFLKDKVDDSIINELDYSRFDNQYLRFIDLYITDSIINLYRNGNDISIKPIKQDIKNNKLPFYIDKNIIVDALDEDSVLNSVYLFSYLTSLDLEQIYKFDPEYAFYLFEGIRNNKTNDIYTNLREHGISFMDDNYESLQKTIKRINKLGRN